MNPNSLPARRVAALVPSSPGVDSARPRWRVSALLLAGVLATALAGCGQWSEDTGAAAGASAAAGSGFAGGEGASPPVGSGGTAGTGSGSADGTPASAGTPQAAPVVLKPAPLAPASGASAGTGTGASAVAGTGAAPSQSPATLVPPPDPPAAVAVEITAGAAVAVPADFVGLHINRWPSGDPVSAPPAYGYGTVRSLNYDPAGAGGVSWYDVNPARGVYQWTRLDQWVQAHHAAGKRLVYTVYGTPAWASTRPGTPDPYGMPGGDSRPADLADLRAFVAALVARYNGDGTRRLQHVEIWNEPDLSGLSYWRDGPEDLAALARAVYQAAKAADPGIVVLGPAWVDFAAERSASNKVRRFMAASDGAGGTGGQWMDAFAWHHYDYRFDIADLVAHQAWVRELLALAGRPGLPSYLTEIGGWQWRADSPTVADQARQIQRWLMVAAAGGQRVAALYMHEVLAHLGDPSTRPAIADAIQAAGQQLAGRTITRGALLADGRIWLAFGDGGTMLR